MKKNTLWTLVPILLVVVFAAAGWLMVTKYQAKKAEYTNMAAEAAAIQAEAQAAFDGVDTSAFDKTADELNGLQQENTDLQNSIDALTEEAARLDADLATQREEYDRRAQEGDNSYYLQVYDSLKEGMSLVEEHLDNG